MCLWIARCPSSFFGLWSFYCIAISRLFKEKPWKVLSIVNTNKFCFWNLGSQSLVSVSNKLTESRSRSGKIFQILVSGLGIEFFPSLCLGLGLNHQGLDYITSSNFFQVSVLVSVSTIRVLTTLLVQIFSKSRSWSRPTGSWLHH